MGSKPIVTGAIVGAIVGAGAAYLFGTKQGRKLRSRAVDFSHDSLDDILDIVDAAIVRSHDVWYRAQAAGDDATSSARAKINSVKRNLRH